MMNKEVIYIDERSWILFIKTAHGLCVYFPGHSGSEELMKKAIYVWNEMNLRQGTRKGISILENIVEIANLHICLN